MVSPSREDAIDPDRESRVIKSLLLGIDDTPASFAAQGVALDLAKRLSVTVTGISVLDAARIAPTAAVPIGALHYKRQADYARLRQASEHQDLARRRLLSEYGWVDRSAGIVHIPVERAMDLVLARAGAGAPGAPTPTVVVPRASPPPTPSMPPGEGPRP